MILKLLFKLLVPIVLILAINAEDQEMNDLFCQLNEYAKLRAINNLDVFPCKHWLKVEKRAYQLTYWYAKVIKPVIKFS